ncbi:MAG: energy-coupling factor transporter transmembrane component T family protein [Actinomycetota bacterium]
MTEIQNESGAQAALKILALFALAVVAIVSDSWWVLGGLFSVPLVWWVAHGRNPLQLVPMLRRTWVFLLFLLLSFLIVPPVTPDPLTVEIGGWTIDLTGLLVGGRMCLRLLTIIVASLVLRETGRPREILLGLRQLRLPLPVAQTIEATLSLVAAQRTGRRGGRQRRKEKREARRSGDAPKLSLSERRRALAGRLASSFHENIERSAAEIGTPADQGARHISAASDVVVVTALVVMVMGLKLMKLLPGIPFASGNKLMLVFPLYFAAARYTRSRVGATWMGATLGVVAFLFGEGRFGVLEIAKYVAAGVILDLLWPIVRRRANVVLYSIAGLLMGIGWFASTLLAAWLASAPVIFYALAGGMAISQLVFSVLSGPVSWMLLRTLDRPIPAEQAQAPVGNAADEPSVVGAGSGSGTGGGRKGPRTPE